MFLSLIRGVMEGQNLNELEQFSRDGDQRRLGKVMYNMALESKFREMDAINARKDAILAEKRRAHEEMVERNREAYLARKVVEDHDAAIIATIARQNNDIDKLDADTDDAVENFLDSF